MTDQSEAKEVLAEMLQRVLNGVDSVVEFSQAQIPDVVEQLLMWNMLHSLFLFVVGVLLGLSVVILSVKVVKHWQIICQNDMEPPTVVFGTVYVIVAGIASMIMTVGNLTWLQILVAPKLYLLEYAAELVK